MHFRLVYYFFHFFYIWKPYLTLTHHRGFFSVLSAVSGIGSLGQGINFLFCSVAFFLIANITQYIQRHIYMLIYPDAVVGISIAILIVLFCAQRLGTDKVGFSFAPIILLWFSFIGGIGLYNLFKYDVSVLRAFNPKYMFDYFKRNGKQGWISLGGVVLAVTGKLFPGSFIFSLFFSHFLLTL